MNTMYIGNRLTHYEMQELLGRPVSRLNQSFAESIRSVSMQMGIKKTQQRKRLEMYVVTEEECNQLIEPAAETLYALQGMECRPLITVKRDDLNNSLMAINNKYGNGMDSETYKLYEAELADAIKANITKVNEDKKIQRKTNTRQLY